MDQLRNRNSASESHTSESESEPHAAEIEPMNLENETQNEYREWFVRAAFSSVRVAILLIYSFFAIVAMLTGTSIVIGNPTWKIISIDFHAIEFTPLAYLTMFYFFVEIFFHLDCFAKTRIFTVREAKIFKNWRCCLWILFAVEIVLCIFILHYHIYPGPKEHNCSTFNESCVNTVTKLFWIPVCHFLSIVLFSIWRQDFKDTEELQAFVGVPI